jgi:hypothetical protein
MALIERLYNPLGLSAAARLSALPAKRFRSRFPLVHPRPVSHARSARAEGSSRQDVSQLTPWPGLRRQVERDTPAGRVGPWSPRLSNEAVGRRRFVEKEIAARPLPPRLQAPKKAPKPAWRCAAPQGYGYSPFCSWSSFHSLISSHDMPSKKLFLWRMRKNRAGNHHLTARPIVVRRHQQSGSQPHS